MALTEAPPEEPADAAPPPPPATNSKPAWIVAGVATAVALIAAMIAVTAVMRDHNDNATLAAANGAQTGGFGNRPVAGTIQSIKGSSFTVKETTFNGQTSTTQVSTTDKTTFRQMVTGALSDLKVGDTVTIAGTTTDNVFTATRVNEASGQANVVRNGPAPARGATGGGPQFFRSGGGGGDMRIGKITGIAGDTITLSAFDGTTVTAKTTASTVVRVTKTITLKSLKVGDQVRVFGTVNGAKVTADEVTKGADDAVAP